LINTADLTSVNQFHPNQLYSKCPLILRDLAKHCLLRPTSLVNLVKAGIPPLAIHRLCSRSWARKSWKWQTAFQTWWHTRRNQISSLGVTDEST